MRKVVLPTNVFASDVKLYQLQNLHQRGPTSDNADIVFIDRGMEIYRRSYNKRLARRIGARIPEVDVQKEYRGEKEKVVLGGKGEPILKWGETPLRQAIVIKARSEESVSKEDVISWILEDLDWFENKNPWRREIEANFKHLRENKYLIIHEDDLYPGVDIPNLVGGKYELEEGPYPTIRLIRDFLSSKKAAKLPVIDEHVRLEETNDTKRNWTTSREGTESLLEFAEEKGYVKKDNELYKPGRSAKG